MDLATLLDHGQTAITYATAAVGAASLLVQAIARITDLTPSDRDNELVTRAGKAVVWVAVVLDRIALNLPSNKARR